MLPKRTQIKLDYIIDNCLLSDKDGDIHDMIYMTKDIFRRYYTKGDIDLIYSKVSSYDVSECLVVLLRYLGYNISIGAYSSFELYDCLYGFAERYKNAI